MRVIVGLFAAKSEGEGGGCVEEVDTTPTQGQPQGSEQTRAVPNAEEIAHDIKASAEAIRAAQPGTSLRAAQTDAIRRSATIPRIDLETLGPPDTEASEHYIWIVPSAVTVIKATAYGRFGHDFDRKKEGTLPVEYLDRMALSNQVFDDTVNVVGKFEDQEGNVGLVISQDAIIADQESPNPTPRQVDDYMRGKGFSPHLDFPSRYVNPTLRIEADDTHTANFIVDRTGKVVPIDLMVRRFA